MHEVSLYHFKCMSAAPPCARFTVVRPLHLPVHGKVAVTITVAVTCASCLLLPTTRASVRIMTTVWFYPTRENLLALLSHLLALPCILVPAQAHILVSAQVTVLVVVLKEVLMVVVAVKFLR